ncbi:MAG TPA: pyridoxal-dependent decarboxylase [Victivallales bacterium]|nr:pyridoxal-dependent decarboxylase [Victivallales bacterium]
MFFKSDLDIVGNALERYYEESVSGEKTTINQLPLKEIINKLDLAYYIKKGNLTGDKLSIFMEKYLEVTTRLHSQNFLAHQIAVPHYSGALASLADGFTNNIKAIYELGPGSTSIDYFLINWFLKKIGWCEAPTDLNVKDNFGKFGGGIFTHGGSLANLTALIAARTKTIPGVWESGNPDNLAILTSHSIHYSIERAAGIIGIGQNSIYYLDSNSNGSIIPDRIDETYNRVIKDNKIPIALVANGGCTAVGRYDSLEEIGIFCNDKNLWFHVDGAHGASVLLSDKYRYLLNGISRADSVTWDAHKLLRTPSLCTALLFKNHMYIDHAFKQEASYLFHNKEQPGVDFANRTIECSSSGLGLKLFMVLGAMGEDGLSKYIDRQIQLTYDAYEYIKTMPGFKCAVKPQNNILCFRVDGSDQLQLNIRDELIREGNYYVSSTLFKKVRYLRLVITNPDSDMENIRQLIEKIKELI